MNQKYVVVVSAAIVLAGLAAFQNCSVRRLSANGTGVDVSSFAGSTVGNNTNTTGSDPGTTTGDNGTTTSKPACMIQPDTAGSITGIAGLPTIETSFGTVQRVANTSLVLMAMSTCADKTSMTVAQKCPSTSANQPCVSQKSLTMMVNLTCDTDKTATACTNFKNSLNKDIPLSDTTLGSKIMLTVTYTPDTCKPSEVTNYFAPFTGAKTGSINIQSLSGLGDGTIAKVKAIGVKLLKNGSDTTNSITVDGLLSSEIITPATCTP